MLNHKVKIAIQKPGDKEQGVIKAGERKIHRRFVKWLLGDELNILVVSPGPSVRTVEIHEVD